MTPLEFKLAIAAAYGWFAFAYASWMRCTGEHPAWGLLWPIFYAVMILFGVAFLLLLPVECLWRCICGGTRIMGWLERRERR